MTALLNLQKLSNNTTDHETINLGKNKESVNIQINYELSESFLSITS